jgi:hypothetical protein
VGSKASEYDLTLGKAIKPQYHNHNHSNSHRRFESVLTQASLMIVRTVLAATVRVVDAVLRQRTESDSHIQRADQLGDVWSEPKARPRKS